MLERSMESLRKDKIDLEDRIEDILSRHDNVESKYREDHHNTVKYFESMLAEYKHRQVTA